MHQNTKAAHIAHLTSAHPRDDVRVFVKMCSSISSFGMRVSLIVADGGGDTKVDGTAIFDVGLASSRFSRMLFSTAKIYRKALEIDADIYHVHDPELLPFALYLQYRKKKIIFDSL